MDPVSQIGMTASEYDILELITGVQSVVHIKNDVPPPYSPPTSQSQIPKIWNPPPPY